MAILRRKSPSGAGKIVFSAQAVGGAVGHNRISILIPCHRVIGTNGSLTGYAGGVEKSLHPEAGRGGSFRTHHPDQGYRFVNKLWKTP